MAAEPRHAGFLGAWRACPHFGRPPCDIKIWEGAWAVLARNPRWHSKGTGVLRCGRVKTQASQAADRCTHGRGPRRQSHGIRTTAALHFKFHTFNLCSQVLRTHLKFILCISCLRRAMWVIYSFHNEL